MATLTEAPPQAPEADAEDKPKVPPEQLALPTLDHREQLALPTLDHRTMDAIELRVGGVIQLDRSDPADCALIRRLRLGEEVTLKVTGLVIQRAGRTAHDRDGYFEGATLVTNVKVTGVTRPAGEQLDVEADAA